MKLLHKLFFEIEMTWKRLILFAIGAALFSAIPDCIPMLEDTSFTAPARTFEIWVLFAVVVIFNCRGYREAMIKTFVFFLVSQPLFYLIEVPFKAEGFGIFRNYPGWFVWTVCTIPGAAIAYYVKKQNICSGIIIALANTLVLACGIDRLNILRDEFPRYLLTHIFCLCCAIVYIVVLLEGKRNKLVATVITVIVLGVLVYLKLADNGAAFTSYPFNETGTWEVQEVPDGIKVELVNDRIEITGERSGDYTFTLVDENGMQLTYDIEVDDSTGLINVHVH